MSVAANTWVREHCTARGTAARAVLMVMADAADKDGNGIKLGPTKIAKQAGLKDVRWVKRVIQKLVDEGHLIPGDVDPKYGTRTYSLPLHHRGEMTTVVNSPLGSNDTSPPGSNRSHPGGQYTTQPNSNNQQPLPVARERANAQVVAELRALLEAGVGKDSKVIRELEAERRRYWDAQIGSEDDHADWCHEEAALGLALLYGQGRLHNADAYLLTALHPDVLPSTITAALAGLGTVDVLSAERLAA